MTTLETFARALLPGDPTFADEVELAASNPSGYVAVFKKRLRLRGIDRPIPSLALVALLDGLIAREALVELDWREDPMAAGAALGSLRILPTATETLGAAVPTMDEGEAEDLPRAAEVWRELLDASPVALLWIDIHSDSYPVLAVAREELERLEAVATACAIRVERSQRAIG